MIRECQADFDEFYWATFGRPEERPSEPLETSGVALNDYEVVELASRAANGGKFRALLNGDISAYPSPSEADAAFHAFLRFWTQDPEQHDRIHRASDLNRPKWEERADYRERTINGALALGGDVYRPKGNGRDGEGRPMTPAEIEALAGDLGAVAILGEPPPPWDDGLIESLAGEVGEAEPEPPEGDRPAAPAPKRNPEPIGCPALPYGARIDPDIGEGFAAWVDRYTAHAMARSPMTPIAFHQSAALFLLGAAVARRLRLPMPFGDVYPNLYILWLAMTTLFRKSTALGLTLDLVRRCFPHLLAAQDTTPEAFLSDLAGKQPPFLETLPESARQQWERERDFAAQRASVVDELSGLLASFGRDYNQGLAEAYLRLYDCEPHYQRSTRGQGRLIVRDAYYSLLGASTPMATAQFLRDDRLWHNGFWPRFAILTPEEDRPQWREPVAQDEPPELEAELRRLYDRLPSPAWPDPPAALDVTLGSGVFDAWQRYNRALSFDLLTPDLDARLYGSYGRLPMMALKVAILLGALDWPEKDRAPRIELPHLARAVTIAEDWRESLHRTLELTDQTDFNRMQERILRQIARATHPEGPTFRDIYRGMQDQKPADIEDILNQMIRAEVVEMRTVKPEGRGRPAQRYRILS